MESRRNNPRSSNTNNRRGTGSGAREYNDRSAKPVLHVGIVVPPQSEPATDLAALPPPLPRISGNRLGAPKPTGLRDRVPRQVPAAPRVPFKPRTQPRKPANELDLPPSAICTVLYVDEALIAVDKAAGYPVTAAPLFQKRCVIKALAAQGYTGLFPINLLDPEASGVVLLSRSPQAAQAMRWNWRSPLCERQYFAVAKGDINGGKGRITFTIGAKVDSRHGVRRHEIMAPELGGRPATTNWRLLARGRRMSRLLITIQSGRCHQIRIHLAALGHPIIGDRQYGHRRNDVPLGQLVDLPSKYRDGSKLPKKQIALHCQKITLPHPFTNQPMEFVAPVPEALLNLMPGAWLVDG